MQRKLISGGEKLDIRPIHHRTDAIHADFHSICYTFFGAKVSHKQTLHFGHSISLIG